MHAGFSVRCKLIRYISYRYILTHTFRAKLMIPLRIYAIIFRTKLPN